MFFPLYMDTSHYSIIPFVRQRRATCIWIHLITPPRARSYSALFAKFAFWKIIFMDETALHRRLLHHCLHHFLSLSLSLFHWHLAVHRRYTQSTAESSELKCCLILEPTLLNFLPRVNWDSPCPWSWYRISVVLKWYDFL